MQQQELADMEAIIDLSENELSEAALRYVAEKMKLEGKVRGVVRFNASRSEDGKVEFSAVVKVLPRD